MRSRFLWMLAGVLAVCAACHRGTDATPADRLLVVDGGVLRDPRTGLEWTSRQDEGSLPWEQADRHCRELAPHEGREWRLPEIDELQALYDLRFDEPCGDRQCHLDPALRLAGPYVWSVTTRGPGTRFYFDFSHGTRLSPGIAPTLVRRVLCVRTGRAP